METESVSTNGSQQNGTRHLPYAFLQHTGRDTSGGRLLRAYWQPVAFSSDVTPNGAPKRLRVMGEDLVIYRDDRGRAGLLGLKCAHRCADLSFGRVEDGGLRCIYHGWLFDVDGRCLEQPAEPKTSTYKDRIRQRAYPTHEAGGAIWAFLGDGEPPLFPNYPAVIAPDAYRFNARWLARCNWLQGNEGNVDPSHTSYLHRFVLDDESERARLGVFAVDIAPELTVEDTRFGVRLYADRSDPRAGDHILRITNGIMPNGCAISGYEAQLGPGGLSMFWHVPIDDTSHWRYEFTFHAKKPLPRERMAAEYAAEKIAGTDEPRRNAENGFLQDRDAMDRYFLGMGKVFPVHDLFVTESQGTFLDHAEEHLSATDVGIARLRKHLLEAVRDMEAGRDPRGVIRDPAENSFDDIVVVTKHVPPGSDNRAVCEQLAASGLYTLNPDMGPPRVL
jgi:phenylpropionate dioxygenase-like ring-hydroxylating dioxygenase large terminal subunit